MNPDIPESWPLLLASLPALALVHEFGHAIAGRLAGFYVAAVGLGSGPWYLHVPLGRRFNFFLGVNLLGGGATVAFPARARIGRGAQAAFHYGGVAAQGLLHLVLLALGRVRPDWEPWLAPVRTLNALAAAANLLPIRLSLGGAAIETDGALAADALGGRGLGEAPAAQVVAARAGPARRRVSNPVGRFVLDLSVAAAGYPLPPGFDWSAPPPSGTPEIYVRRFEMEAERARRPTGA